MMMDCDVHSNTLHTSKDEQWLKWLHKMHLVMWKIHNSDKNPMLSKIESIFIVIIEVLEVEISFPFHRFVPCSLCLTSLCFNKFLRFQSIQMGYIEARTHYHVHVGVYSFPKIYSTTIDDKSSETFSVPLKFFRNPKSV